MQRLLKGPSLPFIWITASLIFIVSTLLDAYSAVWWHGIPHTHIRDFYDDIACSVLVTGLYTYLMYFIRYRRRMIRERIKIVQVTTDEIHTAMRLMLDHIPQNSNDREVVIRATDHIEFVLKEILPWSEGDGASYDVDELVRTSREGLARTRSTKSAAVSSIISDEKRRPER